LQFDAPFNVIKLLLWTWPRGVWAIFTGGGNLNNKKLRNKAKTEELFDPDSEVDALVERCRDSFMAESETWSGKSRSETECPHKSKALEPCNLKTLTESRTLV